MPNLLLFVAFQELQEYVREREAAREARMQTSQENMKTATSKMMRTHQKASNEEALAGDLANAYGIPSRFLPGEAEGALMSRSMSGNALLCSIHFPRHH